MFMRETPMQWSCLYTRKVLLAYVGEANRELAE